MTIAESIRKDVDEIICRWNPDEFKESSSGDFVRINYRIRFIYYKTSFEIKVEFL